MFIGKNPHFAIIRASGLIGGYLFNHLLEQTDATVTIISRRPLNLHHSRSKEIHVEFSNQLALYQAVKGVDAVFVAIGTTQKKVKGDLDAYRKIDYDIPVALARACVTNSIPRFLLVSSVGADTRSRNFYLRLKGEVERAVEQMSIPYIGIFQPSVLIGPRTDWRPGERISQIVMPMVSFLLPDRYRPIPAPVVANAMIREAISDQKGVKRYTYRSMKR